MNYFENCYNHQPKDEVWVSHHFPGRTHIAVGLGQRSFPRMDSAHWLCCCCFRLASHAASLGKKLFEVVLSKAGEPANTKVDSLLSASIDRVVTYHLSEVCKKAVLARLYSKILWSCGVYWNVIFFLVCAANHCVFGSRVGRLGRMLVLLWNMLLCAGLDLWVRLSVMSLSDPVPRITVMVVCDCLLLGICSS